MHPELRNDIDAARLRKLLPKPKVTRKEATTKRAQILNAVNRKLNTQLKIHPAMLKQLGRCYYIVKIGARRDVTVIVVSGEAPLGSKRSTLQNKQLYGQNSYFGYVRFNGDKCVFKRETRILETTTYAEGEVLMTFKLVAAPPDIFTSDIPDAFHYYRGQ